jgi:branched-subunit amino acid transport protein
LWCGDLKEVVMIWVAVLIVGLGSYAFRAIPLILGAKLRLPQHTQDVLRHAGIGGMTALLVSSLVGLGRAGGTTVSLSAIAAVALAAVIARRGASMALAVLAGGAFYGAIGLAVVAFS